MRAKTYAMVALLLAGARNPGNASPPGFAVVELFTSEGCSSCPPAEAMLASLVEESRAEHLPVYAMEWHVDYWDHLGWKDPFDLAQATQRQEDYAKRRSSGIFTPQAVLNGAVFPDHAWNLSEIRGVVGRLLEKPALVQVSLRALPGPGASNCTLYPSLTGSPKDAQLQVALVEDGLGSIPTAGENATRTLHHTRVVRAFRTLPRGWIDGSGFSFPIPTGVDRAN
ncbi:MAG TPA: DUF1223 domain-containing protein, partial [Fibrobacteria bacterium]|nr:DUF1223 domain-containing protein [Fibrobacteria bacterium]